MEEKTRTLNRIQKVLEDANIKLASVATDVLGVSGPAMIQRLIEGETAPHKLADLAQRQLRGKIPELEKALEGLHWPWRGRWWRTWWPSIVGKKIFW